MEGTDGGEGVTLVLKSKDTGTGGARFVHFFSGKNNDEDRWLRDTSIAGKVEPFDDGEIRLTVRDHIFRRRRAELRHFVCA